MKEMKEIKCSDMEVIKEAASEIFDNGFIESEDHSSLIGFRSLSPMIIDINADMQLRILYYREVPVAVRAAISQAFAYEGYYVEFLPYSRGEQFIKIYECVEQ